MTRGPLLSTGEEAGLALRCGQDAFVAFRERAIRESTALALLGKLAVPAVLIAYPAGPLARPLDGVLRAIGGGEALHFPAAYAAFPRVLEMLDPCASWMLALPGFVLLVAALPRVLEGRTDARAGASRALARLPAALVASLPAALLAAAGPAIRNGVAERVFGLPGLGLGVALSAAALALAALVAYAVPAVILGGAGPATAIVRSAVLASRFPRVTLTLLALEAMAAAFLAPSPSVMKARFETLDPGIVPWFLAAGMVALGALEALRLAILARLWLHASGTGRE